MAKKEKSKFTVEIEFEIEDMAHQFVAYMSDGGGEYGFFGNLNDQDWRDHGNGTHKCTGFDYTQGDLKIVAEIKKLENI